MTAALVVERHALVAGAARLDAFIAGDGFNRLGRQNKISLLRQHAALIWNIDVLDRRIAGCCQTEGAIE
jgi:hypothetical protein